MKLFLGCFLILLVGKWANLETGTYSVDDYAEFQWGGRDFSYGLAQGRFSRAALCWLMYYFGISLGESNTVFGLLAMAELSLCAVVVVRFWELKPESLAAVLVSGLWLNHPYFAGLFVFRSASFIIASSLLCAFAGMSFLREKGRRTFVTGVALLAAAYGFYQITANFIAVTLAMAFAASRGATLGSEARRPNFRRDIIGFLISLPLYRLVAKYAEIRFGDPIESRAAMISFDAVKVRSKELVTALWQLVSREDALTALPTKVVLAVFAGLLFIRLARGRRYFACVAIAVAFIWVFGILIFPSTYFFTPRALSSIGLFWAGIAAVTFRTTDRRDVFSTTVAAAVLLIFTASTNRVFSDRARNNLKDHELVNRIAYRLELSPDFEKVRRLAFAGFHRKGGEISTTTGDLNNSAFTYSWSNTTLFYEVTGYRFDPPKASEQRLTDSWCQPQRYWPAPGAIHVEGALAQVCVGPKYFTDGGS